MPIPSMIPGGGSRLLRYLGDRVRFSIRWPKARGSGWRAFLRTNLGRADHLRDETIAALGGAGTFAGGSWRDIPMDAIAPRDSEPPQWTIDLALTEIGWFNAKPYLLDANGHQHWPDGQDIGLTVHPSDYRSANAIYCAFPRMFGAAKHAASTADPLREAMLKTLDDQGYTVIPPSGTLRDLRRELPHIVGKLGCTIVHLLPVGPTPTTHARFGRFGSPYAQLDLTAIDAALAEFDQRTTAVDQFRELTAEAHRLSCRVFLDIVINHTGWNSTLMNTRPEWFQREPHDGPAERPAPFHSPGAWGNTWADLVELEHRDPELWEEIAQALLIWCRRGVDGFRCDAGYMVPLPAWQYVICRVRQEFPRTVFLLEGLGGAWDATATLLTSGNMQWAYSELFQNYDAASIASYLDHHHRHAADLGVLVHYSETHDNDRLAKKGRAWSLFRNRLCALTSQNGAFGFTAGVEWLADEKLDVHQARGMRWGSANHLIPELAAITRLLADDPVFFDGAVIERISGDGAPVVAWLRSAASESCLDGRERMVLVIANPDTATQHLDLSPALVARLPALTLDLLGQSLPTMTSVPGGGRRISLPPLSIACLAAEPVAAGSGDEYRRLRAQAAWAYHCLGQRYDNEELGPSPWIELARWVAAHPVRFLSAIEHLDRPAAKRDVLQALHAAAEQRDLPVVVRWSDADARRDLPVPPGHWILVSDPQPFRVSLARSGDITVHRASVAVDEGHVAALPPTDAALWQDLELERGSHAPLRGRIVRLRPAPDFHPQQLHDLDGVALLTNGRGGMARLRVDLGSIASKYDCLLGANLHPDAPCDRHVLAKRLRAWVNADGFITPLDRRNLVSFEAGPPARWTFNANAGDGRTVAIEVTADMLDGRNTVVLRCARPAVSPRLGRPLPTDADVRLVLRVDLEDRSFHDQTRRSDGAEQHFTTHTSAMPKAAGFRFAPADDRRVSVWCDGGRWLAGAEWSLGIPHAIEASRGMDGSGDAWSPGWFDLPLAHGAEHHLVVDAEATPPTNAEIAGFEIARQKRLSAAIRRAGLPADDRFGRQLAVAAQAYLVRRGSGRTVIAGYPWFLDWGRDTFIAARGLLAAGLDDDVQHLLATFGRFEDGGTLPNLLNGDRAENRDTSDAPLWYAVVADAFAGSDRTRWQLKAGTRTLDTVVRDIACGYLAGTANGIRVDPESCLVWSPAHFTWMDTNYPACTPRQGYPVEIQALWLRLLRLLIRLDAPPAPHQRSWKDLEAIAFAALLRRFWLHDQGYLADVLLAEPGVPASQAQPDDALRPNQVFAVSLGVLTGDVARRIVTACARHLVVPGAIRTLAPLPVNVPLELRSADGRGLNDPWRPYWGGYSGDEDTRRKPAYHNGTAWSWPLPSLCEAIVQAWNGSPDALAAARALLGSMDILLHGHCSGHIPEIADGDTPHTQRGCDAQAWSVTEALRVWKLLQEATVSAS